MDNPIPLHEGEGAAPSLARLLARAEEDAKQLAHDIETLREEARSDAEVSVLVLLADLVKGLSLQIALLFAAAEVEDGDDSGERSRVESLSGAIQRARAEIVRMRAIDSKSAP